MAELPFLPLATDAWLADTFHLSRAERGLYMDLLILMWRTPGCRVPADLDWIARKLGAVGDEREGLKTIVEEFCRTSGNWLTQKRLTAEFERAVASRKKQSVRAKSRWNKENDASRGNAPTPTPTLREEGREGYAHTRAKTDLETPPDLSDMQTLAQECARAAGTRQIEPAQFGRDIALCREWTEAGASPQMILDTIRGGIASASSPIFSLKFFDQPIHTAIARQEALNHGHTASRTNAPDDVTARALARIEARRTAGQG